MPVEKCYLLMQQIARAIKQMICISDAEMEIFLSRAIVKTFKKQEIVSRPAVIPNEIFFINTGIVRVTITGSNCEEHTIHFAQENQFIADYSGFLLKQPSSYTIQALNETNVTVMPRSAIEWGYKNLSQGDKLGRLIAEYYFIYHDSRIRNLYIRTPKERYNSIVETFPGIHDLVPQHMIASYLGITPVHLSRLKKELYKKNN